MIRQAPKWLPYRLRFRIDQARLNHAMAGLESTFPVTAGVSNQALAEVHMLLCARDVRIGVLSIKSLLRFADGHLAVTFTDDGSLTRADRRWVEQHIRGAHWRFWPDHDPLLDDKLAQWPRLKALYASNYPPVCKLIHPMLLPRCPRVIVLDPDTAFFAKPERLMQWGHALDDHNWYMHDHQDEAAAVPDSVQQTFERLQIDMVPAGRRWQLDRRLFNSGLLAFRPSTLSLGFAEQYLAWREALPREEREGKAAIWFGDWTPEQTCYHVMFALGEVPPQPLGEEYHLGGDIGHTFNHFLRHYLVQDATLARLRMMMHEL